MAITECQADRLINSIHKLVEAMTTRGVSSASDEPPIAKIEERLGWHKGIGWTAISVSAAAFLCLFGFVFWKLPHTADVKNAVNDGVAPLSEKMSEKMSAISERLAVLTTTVEFLKPDVSKNLPKAMKQNLQQKGDVELGLRTVTALASRAKEQKVPTDPNAIAEVGEQLLSENLAPKTDGLAWDAVVSLLDYRSFLNSYGKNYSAAFKPPSTEAPHSLPQGIFLYWGGGGIDGGTQKIDGMMLENVTFRNATVVYAGGPVILKNVTFENCEFEIQFSIPARELSRAVLQSASVTLNIAPHA